MNLNQYFWIQKARLKVMIHADSTWFVGVCALNLKNTVVDNLF